MASAQEHYDEGLRNVCKSQANRSAMWYGQASRDFSAAIEADPVLVKAYAQRAVCFAALGEVGKAAEDTARVRELEAMNPATPPDRASAQAFHLRARRAMDGGGLISDALYFLQKAIDADPDFSEAYDARSDVYFTLGMTDASIADIRRVGVLKAGSSRGAVAASSSAVEEQRAPQPASTEDVSKPWWKLW